MPVTISSKSYGLWLAALVGWTLTILGVGEERAMRAACCCVVVRTFTNGKPSGWHWLGVRDVSRETLDESDGF